MSLRPPAVHALGSSHFRDPFCCSDVPGLAIALGLVFCLLWCLACVLRGTYLSSKAQYLGPLLWKLSSPSKVKCSFLTVHSSVSVILVLVFFVMDTHQSACLFCAPPVGAGQRSNPGAELPIAPTGSVYPWPEARGHHR